MAAGLAELRIRSNRLQGRVTSKSRNLATYPTIPEAENWVVDEIVADYSSRPKNFDRAGASEAPKQPRVRETISWTVYSSKAACHCTAKFHISGAKNAVLPIMAETLLTAEKCVIHHVPDLSDVGFMGKILSSLGAAVKFEDGTLTVQAAKIKGHGDYDLIRKMRGSICILGPLLGRLGKAQVSLPGGCVIGTRPIDLHLKGMRDLGAKITIEKGYIIAKAPKLLGTDLFLGGRAGPTCLAPRT